MACAAVLTLPVCAQSTVKDRDQNLMNMTSEGWEWEINAGLNVGGAAPLGMPREVRKVKKYNPGFNTSLEGKVTKWWDANRHWGSSVGLRFENKSMEVNADVKNYHTEIIRDGDRVSGYWTGSVNIKYDATYLTIPITADYRFNDRWKINAGPFISWRYDGSFSGYVTDGYLRSGIPTLARRSSMRKDNRPPMSSTTTCDASPGAHRSEVLACLSPLLGQRQRDLRLQQHLQEGFHHRAKHAPSRLWQYRIRI